MTSRWIGDEGLTSLTLPQSALVIRQCSDLTLNLSDDGRILGLHMTSQLDPAAVSNWIGQRLEDLVLSESAGKLPLLLSDNAAQAGSDGRWRHLNLRTGPGESLPLLLKFFRFVNEGQAKHLVLARDLGPMVSVERQYATEQLRLERALAERAGGMPDPMAPFAAQLGHASLDEILRQAARDIETACIDAALLQSGGDPEQAARLLQTDPEDLQARRARLS